VTALTDVSVLAFRPGRGDVAVAAFRVFYAYGNSTSLGGL